MRYVENLALVPKSIRVYNTNTDIAMPKCAFSAELCSKEVKCECQGGSPRGESGSKGGLFHAGDMLDDHFCELLLGQIGNAMISTTRSETERYYGVKLVQPNEST